MTVSIWQRQEIGCADVECDVCVLGAGITGASVAYWLRRYRPSWKIVVAEKHGGGAGASGRNAGMVLAGLADHYDKMVEDFGREVARSAWAATLEHQKLLNEFLSTSSANVHLERTGSWRTGFTADEGAHLAHSFELMREDGFDAEFVERDPLNRGFHGALGIRNDFGVHPMLLVRALLDRSAIDVYEDCEAYAVERKQKAIVVHTKRAKIRAAHVVVALNAYAPMLDEAFKRLVEPHRGQILVTAPLKVRVLDRLVYTHHGYIYFRQLKDGRMLLGGWRHEYAKTEAGYDEGVTPDVQNALETFLRERFPEVSSTPIEARWSGTMGFSPDGLPLVGTVDGDQRVIYALGFTGHGFGLALEVARRAVRLLLEGEDAGIFAAERLLQTATN
ncbi:MAG: FAD-binding oxidoreductase [Pyrinomonadaceae bacterium]|nr:FAD-binding oxidoreductase [Pyrinomonadaceae bacterium]